MHGNTHLYARESKDSALLRSATDATVPPPLRGKYRAFAERNSAGVRCEAELFCNPAGSTSSYLQDHSRPPIFHAPMIQDIAASFTCIAGFATLGNGDTASRCMPRSDQSCSAGICGS